MARHRAFFDLARSPSVKISFDTFACACETFISIAAFFPESSLFAHTSAYRIDTNFRFDPALLFCDFCCP
jgi:hypothetical protein